MRTMAEITLDSDGITLDTGDVTLDTGGVQLEGAVPGQTEGLGGADVEAMAEQELSEVLSGFKDRAKREDQRFQEATDSEFWIAIYFQSRDQKEEFLNKLGLMEIGDKYLDGMLVAEALGVTLESYIPPMPQLRLDPRLAALAQRVVRRVRGE